LIALGALVGILPKLAGIGLTLIVLALLLALTTALSAWPRFLVPPALRRR
jgi:Na+-transporting methylmalonyl-CoA/oxaloacetate decarboxylase gamma subunit